jgi:hypothetical protein
MAEDAPYPVECIIFVDADRGRCCWFYVGVESGSQQLAIQWDSNIRDATNFALSESRVTELRYCDYDAVWRDIVKAVIVRRSCYFTGYDHRGACVAPPLPRELVDLIVPQMRPHTCLFGPL